MKLVKIRKRYSIKDDNWNTLDSYNLDFELEENQLEHINSVIAKKAKNEEEFKALIYDYLQEIEDEETDFTWWKPSISEIAMTVDIQLVSDKNWELDWRKTAIENLKWASTEEFKNVVDDLISICTGFPDYKKSILEWIWYSFKIASSAWDVYQEKINEKIKVLKEKQDVENNKLDIIFKATSAMFKETWDSTIKTEFVNYSVTSKEVVDINIDKEKFMSSIPRKLLERKVIVTPKKREILAFIKKKMEKWEKIDFASIRKNISLKLNIN